MVCLMKYEKDGLNGTYYAAFFLRLCSRAINHTSIFDFWLTSKHEAFKVMIVYDVPKRGSTSHGT